MSDQRSEKEIEDRGLTLFSIWSGGEDHLPPGVVKDLWEKLDEVDRACWIRLARHIPGVIHFDSATSGGWPTANQADKIRELRKSFPADLWDETHSLIGTTRPYGDMVVIFKAKDKQPGATVDVLIERAYLLHPDGHLEEMHREKVPDGSYVKKEK